MALTKEERESFDAIVCRCCEDCDYCLYNHPGCDFIWDCEYSILVDSREGVYYKFPFGVKRILHW